MRIAHGIVLALAAVLAWACHEPPACYDGEFQACLCGATRGYQVCAAGEYRECVCDGTPGLGGGGGTGGAGGGGLLPFMAACTTDEECETGLCYDFPAKGMFCSHSCSGPGDCQPPSPGCNGMGICKAP